LLFENFASRLLGIWHITRKIRT